MGYKTGGDFLISTHHNPVSSWTQDRELICVSPCWESWEKNLPAQIQIPTANLPPSQFKPEVKKEKGGEVGLQGEKRHVKWSVCTTNKHKSWADLEIQSRQKALKIARTYFSLYLLSVLHGAHLHGDLLKEEGCSEPSWHPNCTFFPIALTEHTHSRHICDVSWQPVTISS